MNKSIHIYIPLYFCLYLLFWFYIWSFRWGFCFEELSWEGFQRERRVIRTGWVFLNSYICLAGAFWALWLITDVNDNQTQRTNVLQWLNQFVLSGNWHYFFVLLLLQPTYAVNTVRTYVPKLGKLIFGTWVWLLAGTPAVISDPHSKVLTHMCTN